MSRHRLLKLCRARQAAMAVGDAALIHAALLLAAPLGAPSGTAALPISAAWIGLLYIGGLYEFQLLCERAGRNRWLGAALLANLACGAALAPAGAGPAVAAAGLLAHAGLLAWRLGWLRLLASAAGCHRLAFVGDSEQIRAIIEDIRARKHPGIRVVAWRRILRPGAESPPLDHWCPTPGAADDAEEPPHLIVLDHALGAEDRAFSAAFSMAIAAGVPAVDDLELYELLYRKVAPRLAATPEWLMSHVLASRPRIYPAFKRLFDVCGALAALLLLSPLIALAALLARGDGGPALYRQRRTGRLGRTFTILKFRTMSAGADTGSPLTDDPNADPRITRFGALLRRSHLDELPQLWNVLAGDMSLVGPRPERPEAIDLLEGRIPGYHLRHLIKPGVTGWAQVNFRATNVPDGTLEKLRYDLYYLKHMSPQLDAAILLRTLKRLLTPESSLPAAEPA